MHREFYFIRHGQTDHNISKSNMTGIDHPECIELNETGRAQALAIEPLIAELPVQTICSSPLKRVQETKEIIAKKLKANHVEIAELGECTGRTWKAMSSLGMYTPLPLDGEVRLFMERVQKGLHLAFSFPAPLLIVAHGGVHWALCCLLGIEEHGWAIDNCVPVHFSMGPNQKWSARKLFC